MKHLREFILSSLAGGLFIILPVYLSFLLLFKAMQAVGVVVKPIAKLLPDWFPAEQFLSFLLVLFVCFLIGAAARTTSGLHIRQRIEKSLFERIPGYTLFRSLTQQLAGSPEANVWKPALAEIEEALVPAFIIEEFEDGRFTVFVPSAPTPISGSIYILTPERVHPVDVPFTHAVRSLSRWGSGSKELVAAMKTGNSPTRKPPSALKFGK
jgi:uncharacterized membrane protein